MATYIFPKIHIFFFNFITPIKFIKKKKFSTPIKKFMDLILKHYQYKYLLYSYLIIYNYIIKGI